MGLLLFFMRIEMSDKKTNNKSADKQAEQVNDFQPMIAKFMAKIPAVKAKVHEAIAEKAPVVKNALVKALDNMAEHSAEAKGVEAKKAKEAQAKADEIQAKADAMKKQTEASGGEEKTAKEEKQEQPNLEVVDESPDKAGKVDEKLASDNVIETDQELDKVDTADLKIANDADEKKEKEA